MESPSVNVKTAVGNVCHSPDGEGALVVDREGTGRGGRSDGEGDNSGEGLHVWRAMREDVAAYSESEVCWPSVEQAMDLLYVGGW